ncbi:MAG: cysteine--tRNA ligase [Oscillospiraceae bacterium]|jgi:cysteinyl-tRNA synthetase|nr:cysteine--tRNA ligase [Oscillospiraceae bacterium]
MRIYNTLTRQKEEFTPADGKTYRIYVCGPTVYNFMHIGNARPLCVFDTLRRYLEYRGCKVKFVQNFTDVDDKIIKKANEEGASPQEIAGRFIAEYWTDANGMNIREADVHPKATEHIDDIIELVQTLIERDNAYEAEGDVYFSTKSFEEYGKLSHQPLEDLEAGARIMVGEVKREPMDFALWKAAKPGEPAWDSPWGPGRPGWHIECSAMARRHLGQTIDLHCGGQDLIFPHHENEIAQSECCNGVPFARFWMHNGHINVDNVKMSKSLGNFFSVREVADKYGYEPIRYLMVASHYRTPINYSVDSIEQAKASLQRLYTCRENLAFALSHADEIGGGNWAAALAAHRENFIAAMEEDFNTADALGCVFELVREINTNLQEASKADLAAAATLFDELTGVLGLVYGRAAAAPEDNPQVRALLVERAQARKEKNWARSDELRTALKALGFAVEDTPQGQKLTQL